MILNGAAAHKARPGDLVIVASYAEFEEAEARTYVPKCVFVDGNNRILEQTGKVIASKEPLPVSRVM